MPVLARVIVRIRDKSRTRPLIQFKNIAIRAAFYLEDIVDLAYRQDDRPPTGLVAENNRVFECNYLPPSTLLRRFPHQRVSATFAHLVLQMGNLPCNCIGLASSDNRPSQLTGTSSS